MGVISDPELKEIVDSMIKRNITSPVLYTSENVSRFNPELGEYYGGSSKLTKVNMKMWDAAKNIIKPKETITSKVDPSIPTDGNELRKVTFSGYDKEGNLLQANVEHDYPVSYIWDYKKQYAVAKVTGADMSQIAFTSFEADGKGNWLFDGNTVKDLNSPTGSFAYDLPLGNIQKVSLDPTVTYIVSYWLKNGGNVSVSGSSNAIISNPVVNSWTHYEHKVGGATSITISGSGRIDELRLYPEKSVMNTYTYKPLVGITSECDANNRIIYYEYDSYNRLRCIRDAQRNILKVIDKQFKQDYRH